MSHNPAPDQAKAQAGGFARYAYDYIEAAIKIDETIGMQPGFELRSPIPAYYLAVHGIELTLKAFLRYHGVTPKALRHPKEFGHDLHAGWRKAKELGIFDIYRPTDRDPKAMTLLVRLNVEQGLRYVRRGEKEFPSWALSNRLPCGCIRPLRRSSGMTRHSPCISVATASEQRHNNRACSRERRTKGA